MSAFGVGVVSTGREEEGRSDGRTAITPRDRRPRQTMQRSLTVGLDGRKLSKEAIESTKGPGQKAEGSTEGGAISVYKDCHLRPL